MRAQRRDANEPEIIGGLAAHGYYFSQYCKCSTHDGSVSRFNSPLAVRLEIKTEDGKLTPRQHEDQRAGRIVIARSLDEALEICTRWL